MKKTVLFSILTLFIASNVYALGETNCSNADGKLKRYEREISNGTNLVTWTVGWGNYDKGRFNENFDYDTKEVLLTKSGQVNGAPSVEEVYAVMVEVETLVLTEEWEKEILSTKKDWVVCRSWQNAAMDLIKEEEEK